MTDDFERKVLEPFRQTYGDIFEVGDVISHAGDSGAVYRARDKYRGLDVCLKFYDHDSKEIRRDWIINATNKVAFLATNYVVLSFTNGDGGLTLVACNEYVNGPNYIDFLAAYAKLKPPEQIVIFPRIVRSVLLPLVSGVAELHRAGIPHADLHDENIKVAMTVHVLGRVDLRLVILDFDNRTTRRPLEPSVAIEEDIANAKGHVSEFLRIAPIGRELLKPIGLATHARTVSFILGMYDQIKWLADAVPAIHDRQWWAMFLSVCSRAEETDSAAIHSFVEVLREIADNFGEGSAFRDAEERIRDPNYDFREDSSEQARSDCASSEPARGSRFDGPSPDDVLRKLARMLGIEAVESDSQYRLGQ